MSAHPLSGRPTRLEEYHSLIRDGVLREDDKVELLRGIIVDMTPQGVAHARAIEELTEFFVLAVNTVAKVRVQLPLTMGDDSEPEPDLALVAIEEASRAEGHPRAALLVIEVAGDSLLKDREVKGGIYARAGIPEYWIVDLASRCVEVYRDPDPGAARYGQVLRATAPESITPAAFPGARLPIARLFPHRVGG